MVPKADHQVADDRRHHGLAFVSQALSSLRAIVFVIVSANALDAHEFGQVALVITIGFAVTELLRAATSHPLALSSSREGMEGALGASVVSYVGLAVVLAVIAAIAAGALSVFDPFGIGALAYVGIAAQDSIRTGSLNVGAAARAVAADVIWLVLLAVALLVVLLAGASAAGVLVAWGVSALLTAVISIVWSGVYQTTRTDVEAYLRSERQIGVKMAAQVGLETIPTRVLPAVAAATIAVSEAGSIRGAETLLGAATVAWSAVAVSVLRPARQHARSAGIRTSLRYVVSWMAVPLVIVAVNAVAVLLLPDRIGDALLGETWDGSRRLVIASSLLLASLIALSIITQTFRAVLMVGSATRVVFIAAVLASISVVPAGSRWGADVALIADAASVSIAVIIGTLLIWRLDPNTGQYEY